MPVFFLLRCTHDILASQSLDVFHVSMSTVRRQIKPVYDDIVNAINGFSCIPAKQEQCSKLIAEMNVLVSRYDALLDARKRKDGDDETPAGPIPDPPPRP
ncbi:MAG: hypothetical protein LBV26_06340 [Bacteroidales bacterium]|jgi:hypothetical protein|nr:hypothetical protein [Bacteroidales bacterium]